METTLELASPSLPCYPGRHSELGTAQQSVITTAIIRNIYYREIMPVQCLKWQQKIWQQTINIGKLDIQIFNSVKG